MELDQFKNVDLVIDKANDNFIQRQFVSQGDLNGRSLTVQVTNDGVIGQTPGLALNLYWHNQASGLTDLSAFSVVDASTNVFKIDYPQNMLTPGKVIAYIQILHGGKVTHTKPFEITVQNLAGTTRGVLATAEYGALVTTLAKANEFETEIAKKADKTQVDALGNEVVDARTDDLGRTYLNLKERLDTNINELDNLFDNLNDKVIKIENDLVITPDNFEGSDIEKLQQVFEYAIDNNIMKINLTRKYDITGGSIYFPRGATYPFSYMVFVGGEIIKNDPGYVFTSLDDNNKRTAPSFINTKFSTTADNCYLYDGDKCIRQSVESCDFKRMGLIKSSSYIQTLRIINCETSGLGCDFVNAKMAYDFEMAFHKGESSGTYSLINIVTDKTNEISFLSLRITDSLFEGFPNTCPIILGTGYGLKINGCYYEANKGSIKFVKSVGVDRLSGQIENCIFNGGLDDDGDVIFDGVTNLAFLLFSGITSNVQSPKYFTNTTYSRLQTNNMNLYSGGKLTNGTILNKEYKSYDVSQIDKQGNGIEFEVKLNLRREGFIGQQLNKQFLFNAKFNYGSTLYFSAHLTGILSFDGYWKSDKVVFGLNVRLLSERNTGGYNNGDIENTPVYDYYFKETGTKEILPNASVATVVFKFPWGKYNASTNINSFTFKGINDMMAEGAFDI